jgi:antitoxin component YwqK of YwqJK toxin-antitoxin module
MKKYISVLLVVLAIACSSCGLFMVFMGIGMMAAGNIQNKYKNLDMFMFGSPYQQTDEKYADKYADQMEAGSQVLRTWYHYTVEETNAAYILKKYQPDTKQMTDFYTYTSEMLEEKNGKCAEWWDNGKKKLVGQYEENLKTGEWNFYNASSGLETAKGFYRKNVKEGVWKYFNPTAGNIILQVNYTNDDKNGPFMVFADDGTIVGKGRYFNGELDTVSWETENKSAYEHLLKYDFPYVAHNVDKMITLKSCDDLTTEENRVACLEESLYELLDTLERPQILSEQGIEGDVQISFTISKDGKIQDIVIDRGLCKELADRCKATLEATEWLPAYKNGTPIEMRYAYEHTFRKSNFYEKEEEETNM